MSDYSNSHSGPASNEPTVPLAPSSNYEQPSVPPVEPTVIDPLGSHESASAYPDFSFDTSPSYSEPASPSAGSRDSWGINPDPLPSTANYPQPAEPTMNVYAEPATQPPAVQQYQQYPISDPAQPASLSVPAPPPGVYGAPQPYAYGQLATHPSSVPALVLGLVGILLWIPFASPIAWYLGARGRRDVFTEPGRWRPSGMLTAGYVLGIVGTLIGALFVGLFIVGVVTGA